MMRFPALSLIAALIQSATFCSAIPLLNDVISSISLRGAATCQNFPNTVAGTKVGSDGRNIPALFASVHKVHPRAITGSIRWCAPDTATYVVFKIFTALAQNVVLDTLAEVFELVQQHLEANGDGVMAAGTFDRFPSDEGLEVSIINANNHQVTWGVLKSALEALGDWMEQFGYGSVVFQIYDGPNQVGRGSILPPR